MYKRIAVTIALCATVTVMLAGVVAADDRFEPNDNFQDAAQISEGEYDLEYNNSDYFAIDLQNGETLDVSVQGDADVNLELYNSAETEVAYRSNTKTPSLEYTAEQTGTHYIVVSDYFSSGLSSYTLDVNVRQDEFEPNHNFKQAAQITEDSYSNLNRTAGENEYFAIDVENGETVDVSVQGDGDMSLEFFNSAESSVAYTDSQRTLSLEYTAEQTGTHYIVVDEDYSSLSSYSMEVNVRQDRFEPNHNFQQAAQITEGVYADLNRTVGESEYFGINLPDGETVSVSVQGDANVALELFNSAESSVAYSDGQQTPSLEYTAEQTGTHYIVVDEDYSSLSSYTLDVNVRQDEFEPNHNFQQAAQVTEGVYTNLNRTVGESEYFGINLPDGETVSISVRGDANVALELFNSAESSVAYSDGQQTPSLEYTTELEGTHYIVVDEDYSSLSSYTLDIQIGRLRSAFTHSPENPAVGETVEFDASDSNYLDGIIESYEWEFGDGTTATGLRPTHTYDSTGNYSVSLTVTSSNGTTATTTEYVEVGESTDTDQPFELEVELQPSANVSQGGSVAVTAYVNNLAGEATTGITTELFVDKNGDGSFSSDEVVASRLTDYPADSYEQVNLTYTDVQLSPGRYQYQARVSKNGQAIKSFTNGALNVTSGDDGGSSAGNLLLDSNGEALGTTQVLMKLAEWSDTGGQNGGKIDGQNVGIQELLGYLGEWQETRQ